MGNVVNAFVSAPVKWVNFRFMDRMIAPLGFYYLAGLINAGEIKIDIDANISDGAQYDPTNTSTTSGRIIIRDRSFGENSLAEKATLIHEGAHAILDRFYPGHDINGKKSTIRIVDDETMGYLAGAIYLIAAGLSNSAIQGTLNYEATRIAKPKVEASMQRGWDGCLTMEFTSQEVKALQTKISRHQFYKNDWNQTATHNG